MKGTNLLNLNEATMIEAVQFWLNAQMKDGKAPIVTSVSFSREHGSSTRFDVRVEEAEKP